MKTRIFTAALLTFALTASAHAASIVATFEETAPGTWDFLVELTPTGGDTSGLAGYSFDVVDVPADQVSFVQGQIRGVDPGTFQAIGFGDASGGAVGGAGSTRYSVGSLQSLTNVDSQVTGIGIEPLDIAGAGTGNDVVVGVPALIGTLTSPAGLTVENFSAIEFSGINAAGGQNIAFSAADVNVLVVPIPEPATLALMGFGLIGLVASRRRS